MMLVSAQIVEKCFIIQTKDKLRLILKTHSLFDLA